MTLVIELKKLHRRTNFTLSIDKVLVRHSQLFYGAHFREVYDGGVSRKSCL